MSIHITVMKKISLYWMVSMSCLMLVSCEQKSMQELEAYVAKIKARPPLKLKPIPTIKPYLRYIYPEQVIDPFDRSALAPRVPVTVNDNTGVVKRIMDKGIQIDKSRVPEYLEGFSLESLFFVGSVTHNNKLWALIRVPDGGVQRVKKGSYIGRNHGKIIKISDQGIQLKELVPNGFGGYKERETQMQLRHD